MTPPAVRSHTRSRTRTRIRTRRRGAALATVLVGALVAAACGGDRSGDSVAIIGDSITAFDQSQLYRDLSQFDLVVSGHPGFTIAETMEPAEFVAGREWDQVIINLGTNDALGQLPVEESAATLEQMIDLFDGADCIHLVNINEYMTNLSTGATVTETARELNDAIDRIASERDRVSVVDWKSETRDTLNDEDPPYSTLTEDSIHPTEEGNARLNEMYVDALDGCGALL